MPLSDTEKAIIPLAAFALGLVMPEVPSMVWSALFTAILSGDLDPQHIKKLLDDNNITVYAAPEDFPREIHD